MADTNEALMLELTESELNDMPPALLRIVDRMQHLLALGKRGRLSKFGHGELAGLNYAVETIFGKTELHGGGDHGR